MLTCADKKIVTIVYGIDKPRVMAGCSKLYEMHFRSMYKTRLVLPSVAPSTLPGSTSPPCGLRGTWQAVTKVPLPVVLQDGGRGGTAGGGVTSGTRDGVKPAQLPARPGCPA